MPTNEMQKNVENTEVFSPSVSAAARRREKTGTVTVPAGRKMARCG